MKMKKLVYLLACTVLFAACSDDDSNAKAKGEKSAVIESIKNKVVFSTFDYEKRVSYLYALDPLNGQYEKIKEFKEEKLADLQNLSYDPVDKYLYAISSKQQLVKFNLEKKETVFIKTLTPYFDVEIEQSFFDKRGRMYTYGYGNAKPVIFNNFILIDKENAKVTKQESSKELSKKLDGNSIAFNAYDEIQDRIVSLVENHNLKEYTTNFSILTLNPTNFSEFDTQTEKNTIAIKQLDYLAIPLGFAVDKNKNYYLGYALEEGDEVALVDTKTGKLNGLFSLYNIYEMMYDKNTNSLYVMSEDKDYNLHLLVYNIDTKQKKSFELKDINLEVFGAVFIN